MDYYNNIIISDFTTLILIESVVEVQILMYQN